MIRFLKIVQIRRGLEELVFMRRFFAKEKGYPKSAPEKLIISGRGGVLAPPAVDIYKKKGLFEKRLQRIEFIGYDIDSVRVHYEQDSTRIEMYP
jgi:hypothetical protein